MNDQKSFEHFLTERFDEFGPGRSMSDEGRDDLRALARETRQRPRWLALIEESPMRTNSHLVVGSPMARVSAVVVATMLLVAMIAGAGIAGARLLAADGAIVVAQDGSGDHTTITEAVAVAEDGDTVLVRPGTYIEAVVVEADITLAGDGPVEDIIVEAPEDGPVAPTGDYRPTSYALLLQDSVATVSGLTFRGEASHVHAKGGSPVLEGLVLEGVGKPYGSGGFGGLNVSGASRATVRDSLFEGGFGVFVVDDSMPLITGNTLRDGAAIGAHFGDGTVIRGNQIIGAPFTAIALYTPTKARAMVIEGNSISDSPNGVWMEPSSGDGEQLIIRSNAITGCMTGVLVSNGSAPIIEKNTLTASTANGLQLSNGAGAALITDNDFVDNATAIGMSRTDAHIEGNTIQGGAAGVVVLRGGTATIISNAIEGAANVGVRVQTGAGPTLTDNRICDNGRNLWVDEGAEPVMQGNDICPDPTTPPAD